MRSIGETIKAKRLALGMSADDLAKKLGKSRATIYRYESSDVESMPIGVLEPLAKALNTTPAELMGWETTGLATNTTLALDNSSLIHALTQAFMRYPKDIQEEIIRRLYKLDVTFSKNINSLLLSYRDYNNFMAKTKITPQMLGDFLRGVPTITTPEEAERIAAFFEVNVVDLFFNNEIKNSESVAAIQKNTLPKQLEENLKLIGHCKGIYKILQKKAKEDFFTLAKLNNYKKMLLDEHVANFINNSIDNIKKELEGRKLNLNLRFVYEIIADEITSTNFIETYVNDKNGTILLLSLILKHF